MQERLSCGVIFHAVGGRVEIEKAGTPVINAQHAGCIEERNPEDNECMDAHDVADQTQPGHPSRIPRNGIDSPRKTLAAMVQAARRSARRSTTVWLSDLGKATVTVRDWTARRSGVRIEGVSRVFSTQERTVARIAMPDHSPIPSNKSPTIGRMRVMCDLAA